MISRIHNFFKIFHKMIHPTLIFLPFVEHSSYPISKYDPDSRKCEKQSIACNRKCCYPNSTPNRHSEKQTELCITILPNTCSIIFRIIPNISRTAEKTKVAPSGIIALQSFSPDLHDDERRLNDETYDYVMNNPIIFKIGFRKYTRNLQIVTEERDETYDFIPFIFINEMEN